MTDGDVKWKGFVERDSSEPRQLIRTGLSQSSRIPSHTLIEHPGFSLIDGVFATD